MKGGQKMPLTASVIPANADTLTYTWYSTDPSIASVDQTGNVSAIKKGVTKVYVKTTAGGYTDTCTVTVTSSLGIANINKIDNFNIYPNPVKSELDVEFNSASDQSCYYDLFYYGSATDKQKY